MVTISRVTSASPTDVWNVLADGWLYPTWVVGASRMRDVEATWPGVGSRLHHSFGLWPLLINDNTEVLVCEPPRHLRLQAKGWPAGEATVDITIEPHALPNGATGSRVVLAEDATKWPGRFVPKPLRSAALAPRNNETLRRLAFLAEGHAGATPTATLPAVPAVGERSRSEPT
jgi:hypothetical protein